MADNLAPNRRCPNLVGSAEAASGEGRDRAIRAAAGERPTMTHSRPETATSLAPLFSPPNLRGPAPSTAGSGSSSIMSSLSGNGTL
jgi:hypothetical protein